MSSLFERARGGLRSALLEWLARHRPNWRGVTFSPPGHFYSPLLDLAQLPASATCMPDDGPEFWEHVDLRGDQQRAYFETILRLVPMPAYPSGGPGTWRYRRDNSWFPLGDAVTLSGILRKERPRRIIEVGSGFSSAVMLDVLEQTGQTAALTFIEPYPERLQTLLRPRDMAVCTVVQQRVQDVPLTTFDALDAQDVLFVDSSHVAKIGSDVAFLLLRVLPRLRAGVLVQFHDIFYPESYPMSWVRAGRAWNESLFLRAFLVGNSAFEIVAFNSFAAARFPERMREVDGFMEASPSSLWLRKVA